MKEDIIAFRQHRSGVLDALKGFSLLGVLTLDYIQHFLYQRTERLIYPWPILQTLDEGLYTLLVSLLELKVLGLFTLVFGLSFHYQYSKQRAKNRSFWQVYTWRLYILAIIGVLLAALMPNGGGLLLLSLLGVILSLVRRLERKTILILSIIFLAQPITWILFLSSFFSPSYASFFTHSGDIYRQMAENAATSNLLPYFYGNLIYGVKSILEVMVMNGLYSIVIGILLLGYWIGREGFLFSRSYDRNWWIRCAQLSMAGAIVFGLASYNFDILISDKVLSKPLVLISKNWADFSMMMTLVSGFVLFYKSERYPKICSVLRTYGRMSLSNYVIQSTIGVFLFLPVGLFLAQYCGTLVSLLIAGCVFTLLVLFSVWWQKRFVRGPLEFLVHKLTWL